MTPITKEVKRQLTPQEDLDYRATLIAAGEELSKSPNLQIILQDLFDEQTYKLMHLRVTPQETDDFSFRLAHNNVHARLETLEYIWNLGYQKEEKMQEFQQLVQARTEQQNYEDQE